MLLQLSTSLPTHLKAQSKSKFKIDFFQVITEGKQKGRNLLTFDKELCCLSFFMARYRIGTFEALYHV